MPPDAFRLDVGSARPRTEGGPRFARPRRWARRRRLHGHVHVRRSRWRGPGHLPGRAETDPESACVLGPIRRTAATRRRPTASSLPAIRPTRRASSRSTSWESGISSCRRPSCSSRTTSPRRRPGRLRRDRARGVHRARPPSASTSPATSRPTSGSRSSTSVSSTSLSRGGAGPSEFGVDGGTGGIGSAEALVAAGTGTRATSRVPRCARAARRQHLVVAEHHGRPRVRRERHRLQHRVRRRRLSGLRRRGRRGPSRFVVIDHVVMPWAWLSRVGPFPDRGGSSTP